MSDNVNLRKMIITKNLVIDNKTFFPEHHRNNKRKILKGVTKEHGSSIAGNAQATSLRVILPFFVDNKIASFAGRSRQISIKND